MIDVAIDGGVAGADVFDASWLAALHARAQCPPREARLPLIARHDSRWLRIGSVTPGFINELLSKSWPAFNSLLSFHEQLNAEHAYPLWCLEGDAGASLHTLAEHMRERGLTGAWRNEQLAVLGYDGAGNSALVGSVERGAVRPFGIATQAVHLLAFTSDGRQWVQQRAHNKPNDPSKWDTTMGGMVSADNTLHEALVRETWEEAGLHVDQLLNLRRAGHVSLSKPSADGKGLGYLEERIDWFSAVVPDGMVPANQDGEVEQFACLTWPQVIEGLHSGDYTDEAALILVQAYEQGLGK